MIATVPVVAPEQVAEVVARARRAQPGWEALGFDGRAAVMKRCQKWISDNADRVIDTIVSETGKAYEDALMAEVSYAEGAFAFWAKNAEGYLAEERVKTASPFAKGRKLIVRYAPLGVVGVIGPWNYPLTNSFGDCIPALMAGNAVAAEALRGHAAHLDADGRDAPRVRPARGRLPGGAGLRRDRRRR